MQTQKVVWKTWREWWMIGTDGEKVSVKFIVCVPWSYLPNPPLGQNMTQGQFLNWVYQVWIQSFPYPRLVASTSLKKTVCPVGRIIGFIPFPRVLVLFEMQSASSSIWTRVAVFISYVDNHYTTGTSMWLDGNDASLFWNQFFKTYFSIILCNDWRYFPLTSNFRFCIVPYSLHLAVAYSVLNISFRCPFTHKIQQMIIF